MSDQTLVSISKCRLNPYEMRCKIITMRAVLQHTLPFNPNTLTDVIGSNALTEVPPLFAAVLDILRHTEAAGAPYHNRLIDHLIKKATVIVTDTRNMCIVRRAMRPLREDDDSGLGPLT